MADSLDLLEASGIPVKRRREWGAVYPASKNSMRLPGRYLFLHLTVTPQRSDKGFASRVVERIGHVRFPNTNMSYTDLLHPGGEVHEGQPRGHKGAHTVNNKEIDGFPHDLNAVGHALGYIGMEDDPFGEAEVEATARWAAAKVLSGESTATQILPHHKFAYKACPGAHATAKLPEINRRFRLYVADGLPGDDMPLSTEDIEKVANAVHRKMTSGDTGAKLVDLVRRAVWESPLGGVRGAASYLSDLPRRIWAYKNENFGPEDAYARLRNAERKECK